MFCAYFLSKTTPPGGPLSFFSVTIFKPYFCHNQSNLVAADNLWYDGAVICPSTTLHYSWRNLLDLVPPQRLTWNLKIMVSNRNFFFQGFIFRFHVSFPGCIQKTAWLIMATHPQDLGFLTTLVLGCNFFWSFSDEALRVGSSWIPE